MPFLCFPQVQGGDIAGAIVEVGSGIGADRVGQRLLVDPALFRDDTRDAPPVGLLGSEADGDFAEFVTVSAGVWQPEHGRQIVQLDPTIGVSVWIW